MTETVDVTGSSCNQQLHTHFAKKSPTIDYDENWNDMFLENEKTEITTKKKRKSNEGSSVKTNEKESYVPKSFNQRTYVSYLKSTKMPLVIALGSAGSGKTLFACIEAISQLKRGIIQKIILTRPLISVEEEEIGFLPGNMNHKMDPWTRPMFDIFREVYEPNELESMVKHGIIEIAPLAFMRGRTFHRSFVLADEMQNSSPSQMLMLTTRLGKDSKMVITGDLQQSDRKSASFSSSFDSNVNGLEHFILLYKQWEKTHEHVNQMLVYQKENEHIYDDEKDDAVIPSHVGIVEMGHDDVFRSPFVSHILDIYYPREMSPLDIHFHKAYIDSLQVPETDSNHSACHMDSNKVQKNSRDDPNYIPLKNMGRPYN